MDTLGRPVRYCRDCALHYRGECPEGWPPSDRSTARNAEPVSPWVRRAREKKLEPKVMG